MLWCEYLISIPKTKRYSLGQKIDCIFVEAIEAAATAGFLSINEKLPYIGRAIQKLDTLKILLIVLWESKALDNKKYIALSVKLDEVGRMLGGWRGQLLKNSPK